MLESSNNILTQEDIAHLLSSSVQDKEIITEKVAKYYSIKDIDNDQKRIAESIFDVLLKDTEESIRKGLAENIKNIDYMPHDIISKLSKDIASVAVPVIECSNVLTDSDLLSIISSGDFEKQKGITSRKVVSAQVSDSLVNTGHEEIIGSLLQNNGAQVLETSYDRILNKFSSNEGIVENIIKRDQVPVSVVTKMINSVSDAIQDKIKGKYPKEFEKILSSIEKSKDIALLKTMGASSSNEMLIKFMSFVDRLDISKDLLPIVALCIGNLEIFNILVSKISNIPLKNIRVLISDKSNKGLKALYAKLPLPSNFCNEVELLVTILRDNEEDFFTKNLAISKEQGNLLISYIMEEIEDSRENFSQIEVVLRIMRKNIDDGLFYG